jgi:hypothetical protein
LDISEECERKLSVASTQIAKYREKLEEMADMKNQLDAEQEARTRIVEK